MANPTPRPAPPTRERIIDAAMRLFGERGFCGTSVTQIEGAAGLSSGAGGIYHYFHSKEDVLAAGINRHLARLEALRDMRKLLTGLDDLRSELTILARYTLAEIDRERDLVRIAASEARARPQLVRAAIGQLIDSSYAEFASWLRERSGGEARSGDGLAEGDGYGNGPVPADRAMTITVIGLGALLSSRMLGALEMSAVAVDDKSLVETWVDMMMIMIGD
jgi:AcrR family transcriptional regulator